MILYLDLSALVKLYVEEDGSETVQDAYSEADITGTSLITRAEVSAAFAKAVRVGMLTEEQGRTVLDQFRTDWPDLVRVACTNIVVSRADSLAWKYDLRGCDSVQLASALFLQESLGEEVTMASFDRTVHQAGEQVGLEVVP